MIILQVPHYIKCGSSYTFSKGGAASVKAAENSCGQPQYRGREGSAGAKGKAYQAKDLVAALQSRGMDICDTSMSRLEGQNRMVQDFEVPILAEVLGVSIEWLLSQEKEKREED